MILCVIPKGKNEEFRLRRHNGKSHEHTNKLEVKDRDGELLFPIENDSYGDSLFSFVQALLKISDLTCLSRERVRSTFLEDFESLMIKTIPANRRAFRWRDSEKDPEGMYLVDCKLNGMSKPYYIFALLNDDKVRDNCPTQL